MNHSISQAPVRLRCEGAENPIGIDQWPPRLSWQIPAGRRGHCQTAYEIASASSVEDLAAGTIWSSGVVTGDQTLHVRYEGPDPGTSARVFWKVRYWDERSVCSEWSEVHWFETGLRGEPWMAGWIGAPYAGSPTASVPCPYLRRTFQLPDRPILRARLAVTALGIHETWINGRKVTEDVFLPGWTDYKKRVPYHIFDAASFLHAGENCLGAILGDGWYCGFLGFWGRRQFYGDRPWFLARLTVDFEDGSSMVIASDSSWRWAVGPLLEADFQMGETYDARRELPGWCEPGSCDGEWSAVAVCDVETPQPSAALTPPVRPIEELRPIAPPRLLEGTTKRWIFDFGQNLVGRVRLRAQGPAGVTMVLRHAETLNPDGSLYLENLRAARATDTFTKATDGEEIYEPRFTFHGFRYAELEGPETAPDQGAVTAVVLHNDLPVTGEFSCSDPLLNQLQSNIVWGQKGNFLEVPTDCPQRDERLGWTGDAQVFLPTAAFNMDVSRFFRKWNQDLRDAQQADGAYPATVPHAFLSFPDGGAGWADAGVICPWRIYCAYGDKELLAGHYPSAKWFVDYLERTSPGLIRGRQDSQADTAAADGDLVGGFGDWLALDGSGKRDGGTPKDLLGTAFFAHSAELVARMARTLGKEQDAGYYDDLAARIRAVFAHRFVTGLLAGPTQTACVLALHFRLVPDEVRAPIFRELVKDIEARGIRLATGFLGTPYLLQVLTEGGRFDLACDLLFQKQWPSWLYAVTQGATTIWERWDGWTHDRGFQTPDMNSFNHYAYGAVGDWMYRTVAGLDQDEDAPAWKKLRIHPNPCPRLSCASAKLATPYGTARSAWRTNGGVFELEVTVPPNCTATVEFPAGSGPDVHERQGDIRKCREIEMLSPKEGTPRLHLSSGDYFFTATIAEN